MAVKEQQVWIYETRGGKRPFNGWFDSLNDRNAQQRIDARLGRVQLGNFGDTRPLAKEFTNSALTTARGIASTLVEMGIRLSSC